MFSHNPLFGIIMLCVFIIFCILEKRINNNDETEYIVLDKSATPDGGRGRHVDEVQFPRAFAFTVNERFIESIYQNYLIF